MVETLPDGSEYTKSGDGETNGITATEVADLGTITVTNSYTPKVTKIHVAKTWDDANDQDGKRDDYTFTVQLYKKVGDAVEKVGDAVEVPVTDGEFKAWDLPVYEGGKFITYYVVETMPDGSEYTKSGDGEATGIAASEIDDLGTITVKNSYEPKVTKIHVAKTWDDAKDQDGKRDDYTFTVQLYKKVGDAVEKVGDAVEVPVTDGEFKAWDLPVYEGGKFITYYVVETMPDGSEYTKSGDGEATGITASEKEDLGTIMITNTYDPEKTSAKVMKVWDDAENQDGKRPESISVTLKAGDTAVETVTLNEANSWTYEKKDLDRYDNGKEIAYTWTEDESKLPEGYSLKSSEKVGLITTITNTYEPEKTSAKVMKVWDDAENQDGKRPESISVTLKAGDTVVETVTLNEANSWTYEKKDLDKYAGGKEIEYTWTEDASKLPEGYSLKSSEKAGLITTITNTYEPEKTTAKVIKVWDDAENKDGKRPKSISVTLKAGDTTVETVTLNEANSWTYEKKDLDKYAGGKEIVYTWTEDESKLPEGYSLKSSEMVGTVTTLTNSYEPETTKITAIKHWKDDSESGKPRKNVQATFHLQKTVDGVSTEIDSVEVGTEQSWTYTWTDLPVYENGKAITYSVKEVLTKANGYKSDTTKWKVVANGGKITITNTLQDATPGTGDNTKTLLWGSLTLTSAIGCGGALWIAGRKKKKETEQ